MTKTVVGGVQMHSKYKFCGFCLAQANQAFHSFWISGLAPVSSGNEETLKPEMMERLDWGRGVGGPNIG